MAPHPKSQSHLLLLAQLTFLLYTGCAPAPAQAYSPEEGIQQVLNNCHPLFIDGKA